MGEKAGDPFYEMGSSFPEMQTQYGNLSGIYYSLPFSICGLFAGYLTRYDNKGLILGIVTILVSSFHLA